MLDIQTPLVKREPHKVYFYIDLYKIYIVLKSDFSERALENSFIYLHTLSGEYEQHHYDIHIHFKCG